MDGLARESSRLRADSEFAQRKLDWLASQAEAAEERARDAELAAAAALAAAAKKVGCELGVWEVQGCVRRAV